MYDLTRAVGKEVESYDESALSVRCAERVLDRNYVRIVRVSAEIRREIRKPAQQYQ